MFARSWEAIKATLAVAALIAAALISADKLDRQKASPERDAALVEPIVTGTIPHAR
jgi:hypothetical protein